MIFSIVAVLVGLALFSDIYAYIAMWAYFRYHKVLLVLLIGSIFVSVVYVRSGPAEIKNKFIWILRVLKKQFLN